MMARFRMFKKGEADVAIGEGVRFSSGLVAASLYNDDRQVGVSLDIGQFRDSLRAQDVELDWLDVPEDDFAEPATPR